MFGYVSGLVILVIVFGFFVVNLEIGKMLLGFMFVFGFDLVIFEGDWVVGLFFVFWYFVFVLLMFLFVLDIERW